MLTKKFFTLQWKELVNLQNVRFRYSGATRFPVTGYIGRIHRSFAEEKLHIYSANAAGELNGPPLKFSLGTLSLPRVLSTGMIVITVASKNPLSGNSFIQILTDTRHPLVTGFFPPPPPPEVPVQTAIEFAVIPESLLKEMET